MKKKTAFDWACLVFIILFLFITVFPFLWIVITSFKTDADIHGAATYALLSAHPTIENYIAVIFDKGVLNAIKNSLIIAALTTVYVTITASMSAYISLGSGLKAGLFWWSLSWEFLCSRR